MRRLVVAVLLLAAAPAPAGLYLPGEPLTVQVGDDGFAVPLPFDVFRNRLADGLLLARDVPPSPARQEALARIPALARSGKADNLATLGAVLLRVRDTDGAYNSLRRALAADPRNFAALANLAVLQQARGESLTALQSQQAALDVMPDDWPAAEPGQWAWYRKVERDWFRRLLRLRAAEERDRPPGRQRPPESLDRLFDVTWVGPLGSYEPGKLNPDQAAKLPPDALAVVQQLLLWLPEDARLVWLLAELYNAAGQLGPAAALFDECASARGFHPPELADHRRKVREAFATQAAAEAVALQTQRFARPADDGGLPSGERVWLVAGAAAALVAAFGALQFREMRRRRRAGRGPDR